MNLGFGELLLIFIVVILVFGSSKLPALGDALGKGIKNFKRTMHEPDAIDVTPKKEPAVPAPAVPVPPSPSATTAAKK
jgi:sec-independent protein translocase protein TatA